MSVDQSSRARLQRRLARMAENDILGLSERQIYAPEAHLNPDHLLPDPTPLFDKNTPIGSMGSCFAREIKSHLQESGYNYVHYGEGPRAAHGSAPWERVYNTACIRQEVERAFGLFDPDPVADSEGRMHDLHRMKTVFNSSEEATATIAQYKQQARAALMDSDVFIITLGLSEVWYDQKTNRVFAQVPPKSAYVAERHAFRLLTPDENVVNVRTAIELLRQHNPHVQVILTVSPVPLRATFFNRSVVVSNHVSKSTLLYTAHAITQELDGVHYFPSYEITHHLVEEPFDWDSRHVTKAAVDMIMDLFHRTFGSQSKHE
ncbi:GSCFA domain-containing protein [Halochromatium glycolicum]|uniref:GSCFA domain-containing protein n=1 Tax=Halochromatium glycolicum TaxID=85075 RepID=A0AAJ0U7R0_9GAMM|nr:GSCFA domain-containing protein [Halochromatium glycolicum]MBK1706875.1 hypothetical protein [Halochromatium glycolicum]